jgi:hypothetical protein
MTGRQATYLPGAPTTQDEVMSDLPQLPTLPVEPDSEVTIDDRLIIVLGRQRPSGSAASGRAPAEQRGQSGLNPFRTA